MDADGWALDDTRKPLLEKDKLGAVLKIPLSVEDHVKNNLPDILARWSQREMDERKNPRTAQSFCVPKTEMAAHGYDLSLNRYKEVVHQEAEHRPVGEILRSLARLGTEIQQGMTELERMLK